MTGKISRQKVARDWAKGGGVRSCSSAVSSPRCLFLALHRTDEENEEVMAAKLLADMQQRQRDKDESKEKRKALWRAKQASIEKGGKSSFQIKGDPDNQRAAAGPGAGGATIVGGSGAVQAAAAS